MTTPTNILPPLPQSWSALTWQQLCDVWTCKMRYGGNPDVARAAALLALCGLTPVAGPAMLASGPTSGSHDPRTGEQLYRLATADGRLFTATARQLAHMAKASLPWLDYPYGDPGKEAVKAASKREQNGARSDSAEREQARPKGKDERGKVVEEAVEPHRGYVSQMRDAMILSEEHVVIVGDRLVPGSQWLAMSDEERYTMIRSEHLGSNDEQRRRAVAKDWQHATEQERQQILHSSLFALRFSLPLAAMANLTWEQYRSLQPLPPTLFREGLADQEALRLQAEFVSYCLVPEGEPDQAGNRYHYSPFTAEQTQPTWRRLLEQGSPIYQICFQTYQTAMGYYRETFPLLFQSGGKSDPVKDALVGEVDTLNAIMKYQGYIRQQDVYETNLPIVFSVLNTMTKEAKEIEKLNRGIKKH